MAIILFCWKGHDLSVYDGTVRMRCSHRDLIAMAERAGWEGQQPRQPFCTKCGAATLDSWEHCKAAIPNGRPARLLWSMRKAFPMDRNGPESRTGIRGRTQLSSDETAALKSTRNDVASGSPRTELAAHRFKRFLQKIGPVAGDTLKTIVVNFATEGAMETLGISPTGGRQCQLR